MQHFVTFLQDYGKSDWKICYYLCQALPGLFGLIDPKIVIFDHIRLWWCRIKKITTFQKWHCRPTVFPINHLTRFQTYGLISSKSMLIYHLKLEWVVLYLDLGCICRYDWYATEQPTVLGLNKQCPQGMLCFIMFSNNQLCCRKDVHTPILGTID